MQEKLYLIGFEKNGIKIELYLDEENKEYIVRGCDPEFGYEMAFNISILKQVDKILDDISDKMIDDIKISRGA